MLSTLTQQRALASMKAPMSLQLFPDTPAGTHYTALVQHKGGTRTQAKKCCPQYCTKKLFKSLYQDPCSYRRCSRHWLAFMVIVLATLAVAVSFFWHPHKSKETPRLLEPEPGLVALDHEVQLR